MAELHSPCNRSSGGMRLHVKVLWATEEAYEVGSFWDARQRYHPKRYCVHYCVSGVLPVLGYLTTETDQSGRIWFLLVRMGPLWKQQEVTNKRSAITAAPIPHKFWSFPIAIASTFIASTIEQLFLGYRLYTLYAKSLQHSRRPSIHHCLVRKIGCTRLS